MVPTKSTFRFHFSLVVSLCKDCLLFYDFIDMKKADHEHIVGQLSAAHEIKLKEVRSKHKREVHKLQQELKNVRAVLTRAQASIEEQNKVNAQRRELITAATTAATKTACTETAKILKEEYKKSLTEVEDKHKREMSELQEKLAKVTHERDEARAAMLATVKHDKESLASYASGAAEFLATLQIEGTEEFVSDLTVFHQDGL